MEPTSADPLDPTLSRRTLLRGAAALGLVGAAGGLGLAACGGDDDAAGGDGDASTASEPTESDRVLVLMTNAAATQAAGEEGRLPLGVGDSTGALLLDAPDSLSITVEDQEGTEVQAATEVPRRDAGLERAYYPLAFTAPAAGFYVARAELDGQPLEAAFEVSATDAVVIPRPGQPLPATPTPTTADAGGVDPICTADPQCPLHEVDLEEVLGTAPVAVLVSTPAFCATAICGPVLDLFEAAAEAHPDITFIHVEPYASGTLVEEEGPSADNLSPAVEAWSLPFEPCLFLVDAEGTVVERLDVIYDADELDAALALLQA